MPKGEKVVRVVKPRVVKDVVEPAEAAKAEAAKEPPAEPRRKPGPKPRGKTATVPTPKKKHQRKGVPREPKPRKSSAKYIHDPTEPDRCHAEAKTTGARCMNQSTPGKKVCIMHGGSPKSGAPVTHGLRAFGNSSLAGIYDRVAGNIEGMRDMDATLAAAHTLFHRSIERYGECDTPGFRAQALSTFDQAQALSSQGKHAEAALKLREHRALLVRGVAESRAIEQVEISLERVQKFQVDLAKLMYTAQRTFNEGQLAAFFARWVEEVAKVAGIETAETIARTFGVNENTFAFAASY